MKRFCITFGLMIVCVLGFGGSAVAANVVNYTIKSDIVTYINNYAIESFNIDGKTAIIAEDLRNYGFDVLYNNDTRILAIYNDSADKLMPYGALDANMRAGKNSKGETIVRWQYNLGTPQYPIYSTDIQTYLDDEWIPGFNIGGRTAIFTDALAKCGRVQYSNETRNLYIWLDDKEMNWNFGITPYETPYYNVVFDIDTALAYLRGYWEDQNMYVFSPVISGYETVQRDGNGKYFDIRCKSWLYDSHIFRVYESGKVEAVG